MGFQVHTCGCGVSRSFDVFGRATCSCREPIRARRSIAARETCEGCPVVRVADPPHDLKELLRVLCGGL
ncbi:hypothetical protein BD414DRAFT_484178, partial [Trametes punicea]